MTHTMPLYIDEKFAKLVSNKLPLFKALSGGSTVANFRCPLCGDSQKCKTKKRGYFYVHKDTLMMKCHNCSASMSFGHFLKMIDPILHKEYVRDTFKFDNDHRWYDKYSKEREEKVEKKLVTTKKTTKALSHLECVLNLSEDHPCKKYVRKRKIPFKYWKDLYYAENYQRWIHQHVDKSKFKYPAKTDPRLVIPFRTKKEKVFAYQGRYIGNDPKVLRYITINPNESILIYGLNTVDVNKTVYIFEGPIDSMYIPNSLAVAGSSLAKLLKTKNPNFVFVFDNERRAKDITNIMQKIITTGANVVVWPKDIVEKDIGTMIENDYEVTNILDILSKNTYNGLQAELKFKDWKIV